MRSDAESYQGVTVSSFHLFLMPALWPRRIKFSLAENFDPRNTFTPAIDFVAKRVAQKTEMLGSAGHLSDFK